MSFRSSLRGIGVVFGLGAALTLVGCGDMSAPVGSSMAGSEITGVAHGGHHVPGHLLEGVVQEKDDRRQRHAAQLRADFLHSRRLRGACNHTFQPAAGLGNPRGS